MFVARGSGQTTSANLYVKLVALFVAGVLVGVGIGYAYFQPTVAELKTQLQSAHDEATSLRAKYEAAASERERLETLISAANASLTSLRQELDEKRSELKAARSDLAALREKAASAEKELALRENRLDMLRRAVEKIDKDRKLLIQMRMRIPDTRDEAKEYWNTMRRLAAEADPALTPSVDTIISLLDPYFDWLEKAPGPGATLQEFLDWLLSMPPEAAEYSDAIDNFRRDVYLVVIVDVKAAVDLLS